MKGSKKYFYLQKVERFFERLFCDRKFYYAIFNKFSCELNPGKYRLFWDGIRFVWMRESLSQWVKAFSKYSLGTKIRILCFRNYAINSFSKGAVAGDELIISRRHNSAKIFFREKHRVVTYFLNKSEFDITYSFLNEYIPYFGTTTILSLDSEQAKMTEKLICEKDGWKSDNEKKYKCICWFMEGLLKYCINTPPVSYEKVENIVQRIDSYPFSSRVEKMALGEIVNQLVDGIEDEEKKNELPYINSHCDLSFFNILYDGVKFFLIDWEYYHANLFCFDSLYWMSYEAMVNNDYSFFDEYFVGGYDDWLEQIFNASGFPYYKEKRRSYIYLLLLSELEMHLFYSEMGSVRSYGDFIKVIRYLDNQKG